MKTYKHIFMQVSLLIACLFIQPVFAAGNLYPTSLTWLSDWQVVLNQSQLHPSLKNAKVILPAIEYGEKSNFSLNLSDGKTVIGCLFVTRDWQFTGHFALNRTRYQEGAVAIAPEEAEANAKAFVLALYKDTPGKLVISERERQNIYGQFKFTFAFFVEDICVRSVSVRVSYNGYIISASHYNLFREDPDILTKISPSPDVDTILAGGKEYLRKQGYEESTIANMTRIITFPPNQVKPSFTWKGAAKRNADGKTFWAEITYDETTQQFTLSTWRNSPEQMKRSYMPNSADYPVWSADGKTLWWTTASHWVGLPAWIESPPFSLATSTLLPTHQFSRPLLYRPIPDLDSLNMMYTRPSLSPDGRWLVTMLYSQTLLAVDLQNNRLYAIPGDHYIEHRVSWSQDSREIVFVDERAKRLYWMHVSNNPGVPFDVRERYVQVKDRVFQAEFIPNEKNRLFALVQKQEPGGKKGDWQLAFIDLPDVKDDNAPPPVTPAPPPSADGKEQRMEMKVVEGSTAQPLIIQGATIQPVLDLPSQPFGMHVLPDGKGAIVILQNGGYRVSFANRTLAPIPWLAKDYQIAEDTYVLPVMGFDVSPDGKQIAFSAFTREKGPGGVICVADMDGKNIQRVSGGIEDRLERYRLQGKYLYVPKEQIPFGLMGKLGYSEFHDIEWPATLWGPWYRIAPSQNNAPGNR